MSIPIVRFLITRPRAEEREFSPTAKDASSMPEVTLVRDRRSTFVIASWMLIFYYTLFRQNAFVEVNGSDRNIIVK